MLKINILTVGNVKESYLRDGVDEYLKRAAPFFEIKIVEFKEDRSVEKEGEALLKSPFFRAKSYNAALCVEGKSISSEEFARMFESAASSGFDSVNFIIGGSDGLSDEVKSACRARISFSALTFPHRLARLILAEQIYRAATILNNIRYHK